MVADGPRPTPVRSPFARRSNPVRSVIEALGSCPMERPGPTALVYTAFTTSHTGPYIRRSRRRTRGRIYGVRDVVHGAVYTAFATSYTGPYTRRSRRRTRGRIYGVRDVAHGVVYTAFATSHTGPYTWGSRRRTRGRIYGVRAVRAVRVAVRDVLSRTARNQILLTFACTCLPVACS
jgi:hypothetical protein